MGRAYEVRKSSIQKTGAAKAKLYSMYAREIYSVAKNNGIDPNTNLNLKRLIEKAKKDQVPQDIIKRAIDKVSSGVDESYSKVRYEIFGPGSSTALVDCLTDNVNRTISEIRTVINKTKTKLGVLGSVSYNYDHVSILIVNNSTMENIFEKVMEDGIEINDIETEENSVVIYGKPEDLYIIKESINELPNVLIEIEKIVMIPKTYVELSVVELEIFNKMLTMLEEIDDVQEIYHNVNLDLK